MRRFVRRCANVQAARSRPASSSSIRSRYGQRKRGPRGYDGGKRLVGRKRHIAVDTLGLVHALVVHVASIQDRDGARLVLGRLQWEHYPRLVEVWADSAYRGALERWAADELGLALRIVSKLEGQRGFVVLPKRWIVERTFAWLMKCRRLGRDHEALPCTSEAWVRLAMIGLMLRRLNPT